MRTLKKTLCLVLCLAMMAGLCVFASADFKDADKIENTEAVTILTGLGVIQGDEKGNFNPQGTLTRAEATTIITKILGGDGLAITTDKFTDVAESFWGMPYIAYCVAEGIVVGNGDGTFGPNDKLTGYAWATMLLRALGYEISGETWQIDVAKLVKSLGLLDGFVGTKEISRDDACQMAYNAINVAPDGETKQYVVYEDSTLANELYRGTNEVIAYLTKADHSGSVLKEVTVKEGSLGKTNFNLTEATSTDDFGRTSTIYTNGKETTDKDYKVYASFEPTAVATYTEATTLGKIAGALGAGATKDSGVTLNVIKNGYDDDAKNSETLKTSDTPIGGQGTLIEIYKTGDKAYNVVVIETFVRKLVKSDIVAAKAATSTADAVTAGIMLDGVKYETTAFKQGDVVLYTKKTSNGTTATKIVNVVKADSTTGSITATAAGYFRIDGTKAVKAAYAAKTTGTGTSAVANDAWGSTQAPYSVSDNEVSFFFDNYGNVVYAEVGAIAAIQDNYIYVVDFAAKAAKSDGGDDLFGTGAVTGAAQAQAKVLNLENGKLEIVDVAIVEGTDGRFYYATRSGASSGEEVGDYSSGDASTALYVGNGLRKFVKLEDGSYAIDPQNVTTTTVSTTKGSPVAGSNYMTDKTVLTVVEYTTKNGAITGASVTTTTGYKNIATGDSYTGIVTVDDNNFVTSILVVKAANTTTKANYAIYKGVGETDAEGTYYEFYVKGELVSYIDDGKYDDTNPWVVGTVYDLTVGNKAVTGTPATTVPAASGEVTAIQGEYMLVKSGSTTSVVYFASEYTVVTAAGDEVVELAVGDVITGYGKDSTVDFITVAPVA